MHHEEGIGKQTVKELESLDAIAKCLRMVLKGAALEVVELSEDSVSSDVLHFVVTRQLVVMGPFCGAFTPINDEILNKLTATDFLIDVPNMITISGLKSFVERLSEGKQKVRFGRINTNFSLDGMSFLISPNVNLRVVRGENFIIFFQGPIFRKIWPR
ncbi:hypothetical protein TELCIR_03989 [Teladorsagia circumcincta]|uniref:Uncharacterized protein n=1 Tax=Teladorsagia circumcincta TaxID=45464 RepID=A0A2G9UV29_TELCI|nr:hypothetical protein TELCIR_03989 [Teladorsagia circumcincta]